MVITTNAGLWRYLIGDTVRFTTTNPYRIKITGRTKHFINAFGEEVVIENVESAIAYASELCEAEVKHFTVAPRYLESAQQGSHEWLIEFIREPEDKPRFERLIDEHIRKHNSDYDAKRYRDMALIAPIVHYAKKNTFYNWLKKNNKLGGQNKVPRLANHRAYLESILAAQSAQ